MTGGFILQKETGLNFRGADYRIVPESRDFDAIKPTEPNRVHL